jgi:hypothetical protein
MFAPLGYGCDVVLPLHDMPQPRRQSLQIPRYEFVCVVKTHRRAIFLAALSN